MKKAWRANPVPRNGSGVFGAPSGTTATPNTVIESAPYNAFVTDVADALTDSINVDGTAPFQANQPMATFKLTGLGAGSAATDSIQLGQAQSNIVGHAASVGGTADAITATFSPVFTAYTAKMRLRFTAGGANTVTNPTINVDGLGAKTIKKHAASALAIGDIAGSGHICDLVYDGTDFLLMNPAFDPPRESLIIAASDESTAITATADKVKFRMPYAFTLSAVRASLSTAQSSGNIFTVDIHESGTTILSTKITIDNNEKTSTTAATPSVISDTSLADDAEITTDVDQIGDGTAKGLKVYLIGRRTS
jgi:hypothetical protein